MASTSSTQSKTVTLRREDMKRFPAAFETRETTEDRQGELARVLASSFLKYASQTDALCEDNVDSFIQLHQFHNELLDLATEFLQQEIRIVADGSNLDDLLLAFAGFRLSKISQCYYESRIAGMSEDETIRWKKTLYECQLNYNRICQAIQ